LSLASAFLTHTVIPAQAGIHASFQVFDVRVTFWKRVAASTQLRQKRLLTLAWIPACAGMT
jgi:hypothetical protein